MPPSPALGFQRLELTAPPDREDRLTAELWEMGTCGLQSLPDGEGRVRLRAYFQQTVPPRDPGFWRLLGAEFLSLVEVGDEDWLKPFRRRAQPFPLGRSLVIDPGEPGSSPPPPASGRRLLRLPARRAFGVGTHASTRLAVELMERTGMRGKRVLDLGTGTGILAFLAQLGGSRSVVGLEIDPRAILAAAENRSLNGLAPGLVAGSLRCLAPVRLFDLVVANLLPVELEPELQELAARLRPGGELIVSGLLRRQEYDLKIALEGRGFVVIESSYEEEWCALTASLRS